jgi:hypothetical protein
MAMLSFLGDRETRGRKSARSPRRPPRNPTRRCWGQGELTRGLPHAGLTHTSFLAEDFGCEGHHAGSIAVHMDADTPPLALAYARVRRSARQPTGPPWPAASQRPACLPAACLPAARQPASPSQPAPSQRPASQCHPSPPLSPSPLTPHPCRPTRTSWPRPTSRASSASSTQRPGSCRMLCEAATRARWRSGRPTTTAPTTWPGSRWAAAGLAGGGEPGCRRSRLPSCCRKQRQPGQRLRPSCCAAPSP